MKTDLFKLPVIQFHLRRHTARPMGVPLPVHTRTPASGRRRGRLGLLTVLILIGILWVGLPAARAWFLLQTSPFRSAPAHIHGFAVQDIGFTASDGVHLSGWLVRCCSRAPTVVLIPGFKENRVSMVPYARFLGHAGFNVLLYDSRGTGGSNGEFSLGVREVNDVRGAIHYLMRRRDLPVHRYGLLGVSLGAGVAIVAATHLLAVRAIVADSVYVNQHALVRRLDILPLGPLRIPLVPVASWAVDHLVGQDFESFSPLHAASTLGSRALLLIHSRHDLNSTTPLHGAYAVERAAGTSGTLWVAPRGAHAGALAAQPVIYQRHVVVFFRHHLRP